MTSEFMLNHGETLLQCPYVKAHLVTNARIMTHLVQCRNSYLKNMNEEERKKVNRICRHNATHHYPLPEIEFHEERCPDAISVVRHMAYHNSEEGERDYERRHKQDLEINTTFPTKSIRTETKPAPSHSWDSVEEDWEKEAFQPAYDPETKLKKEFVMYNPTGLTKSERKKIREEVRLKVNEMDFVDNVELPTAANFERKPDLKQSHLQDDVKYEEESESEENSRKDRDKESKESSSRKDREKESSSRKDREKESSSRKDREKESSSRKYRENESSGKVPDNKKSRRDRDTESSRRDRDTESSRRDRDTESSRRDCDTESSRRDRDTESSKRDRDTESSRRDRDTESSRRDRDTESSRRDRDSESSRRDRDTESSRRDRNSENYYPATSSRDRNYNRFGRDRRSTDNRDNDNERSTKDQRTATSSKTAKTTNSVQPQTSNQGNARSDKWLLQKSEHYDDDFKGWNPSKNPTV